MLAFRDRQNRAKFREGNKVRNILKCPDTNQRFCLNLTCMVKCQHAFYVIFFSLLPTGRTGRLTCSVLNDETRPSFHFCTTRRHPTQFSPQEHIANPLVAAQRLTILAIASLLGFLCAPRWCAPHINRHGLCENSCCRVSAGGERP